ncbi:MAG: DUF177 domain-containing protein [Ignavibacteria bacterium]|nr:DUF177 domain-containing protein [Ignavibacteria bacterium]
MKIIISNIAEGEHFYDFKEDPAILNLEGFVLKDEITANVRLLKSNRQIYVEVKYSCNFVFPCDRCLLEFEKNISGSFEVVYKYSRDPEDISTGNDENIFFISPEKNFIDIKELLREYIIINIPMRKVPEETEGRCSFCGKTAEEILRTAAPEEINPVWNKLLKKKI